MSITASPRPPIAPPVGALSACVDLDAIAHNVSLIGAASPVMAVVKADGFGHGALPVARAALDAGAVGLGVATIDEALALRSGGIEAPILAWLYDPSAPLAAAIEQRIELALSSPAQLAAIVRAQGSVGREPARIQLQADTGLHRGGCDHGDWPALVSATRRAQLAGAVSVVGTWSHLSHPSEPDHPETLRQLARLGEAVAQVREGGIAPGIRHLANSAAALAAPATRLDLVRAGIGIYGVEPCADRSFGLRAAMRVTARVAAVHHVPAGDGIGYDHTVHATRNTTLALVPAGYADGIPLAASSRSFMTIAGRRCRVVGRVAMDQLTLDVTGLDVAIGDEVTILGGGPGEPSAAEWATSTGAVPHELLTGLGNGPRLTRSYRRTA